ncbi:hypothetical protein V2J94_03810 [Streptomyces sp. DSM 41524]|uniref:VOC domain-containing protein n=1 Tax=Streptomyces asiaticus subsp. ignotus TaxID=3098222 RepID=A0ABU7PPK9_9ACTN|nr:hypothetical protein [Streptomyces sp. DSM 41524]
MIYPAPAALPTGEEQERYLDSVLGWFKEAARTTPDTALTGFLGHPVDLRTLRITGLHHVAVYVGDYDREEDFDQWLALVEKSPDTEDVRSGPSHIAPREYGTPGHWINCRAHGQELELFTCRARGGWADRPAGQKNALMSHFGLAVDAPDHVRPLLDYLATFDGVELLTFAPEDELGHTYGHLLRRDTDRVLELVHPGGSSPGR